MILVRDAEARVSELPILFKNIRRNGKYHRSECQKIRNNQLPPFRIKNEYQCDFGE